MKVHRQNSRRSTSPRLADRAWRWISLAAGSGRAAQKIDREMGSRGVVIANVAGAIWWASSEAWADRAGR